MIKLFLSLLHYSIYLNPYSVNFIREFLRVLKSGGIAVFQIPTNGPKLSIWKRLRSFIRIRERLALIGGGIGSSFQMGMYICFHERDNIYY